MSRIQEREESQYSEEVSQVMKFHIRQNLARTQLLIYLTITLLILGSTITSQIPAAMFVKADEDEGDAGDDDSERSSSSPSIADKSSDQSLNSQLAILNSTESTSCKQAPIQTVSSSEDHSNGDEDENGDGDAMNVLDGDSETEWLAADLGSYLQLDLGKVKKICSVDATWSEGDEKSNNFVLSVSKDGTNFEDVLRRLE